MNEYVVTVHAILNEPIPVLDNGKPSGRMCPGYYQKLMVRARSEAETRALVEAHAENAKINWADSSIELHKKNVWRKTSKITWHTGRMFYPDVEFR